jgi:hypothetical protein
MLHLVFLPSWRYAHGWLRQLDFPRNRHRRRVLATAHALDIEVIDLVPSFLAHDAPSSLFLGPGKHYSAEGHALVAQEIASALSRSRGRIDAATKDGASNSH